MTATKAFLLIAFVLVLVAGIAAGLLRDFASRDKAILGGIVTSVTAAGNDYKSPTPRLTRVDIRLDDGREVFVSSGNTLLRGLDKGARSPSDRRRGGRRGTRSSSRCRRPSKPPQRRSPGLERLPPIPVAGAATDRLPRRTDISDPCRGRAMGSAERPAGTETADMREETRARFEREVRKQQLRKGAGIVLTVAALMTVIVLAYSNSNRGPDDLVSEATVPATVKFWYQAPVRAAQGQDLISVTATLDNGRDVQAGSLSHNQAHAGDRIELTERHYKSGRTTYVWK